MRKFALLHLHIFLLHFATHAQSNQRLRTWTEKAQQGNPLKLNHSPLRQLSPGGTNSGKIFGSNSFFSLDPKALDQLRSATGKISFSLPTKNDGLVQLALVKQEIAMPGFKITTSSKRKIDAESFVKSQF